MLKKYIEQHRSILESTIRDLLERKKVMHKDHPLYLQAIDALLDCVSEGKMLRGILVIFSYEIEDKATNKELYKVAAAMEIFHTALLIHDDIMDNDLTRRSKPTTFAQYEQTGQKNQAQDTHLYGQSMAICIADLAFFMAYEILSQSHSPAALEVIRTFSHELQAVVYAQISDVHFGQTVDEPSQEEIMTVYQYKTARYSFSLPFMVGSRLGNVSDDLVKKLETFGEELGIIFQIKDDELSIFGDPQITGKPTGSDIRENKKTLLRHLLYVKATDKEKKELDTIFGKPITEQSLHNIRQLITQTGVENTLKELVDRKVAIIQELLDNLDLSENKKAFLQELVKFNLHRTK